MEVMDVYIAVLMCVASCPHFSYGSTIEVTRALNVGDDLTLDCLTDWGPNIDLHWLQKPRHSQKYKYIARAGTNYPNGEIHENIRNDARISHSYNTSINTSTNEKKLNLSLHMSNLTEQDSGEYTCSLTNVSQYETTNVYIYDISVITCNCSINTNANCDLLGFSGSRWQSVSISFEGGNITSEVIGSSFTFSTSHFSDLTKYHSIRVSSSDGVFSNVTCTLPHQRNPSSTSKTTTTFVKPSSSSEQMITADSKEVTTTALTTLLEKQVSTNSTGMKLFVSDASLSPMGVNMSDAPSESHPTSTTDMTEKPLTKEVLQSTSVLKTTQTDMKSTSQSAEFKNNIIIIVISISISAGAVILVVIIVMHTRRRNYKPRSVRGKIKLQRGLEKSPRASLRPQTRSTAIPDFTFQNSAMKNCHLHVEESTDDHYYSSVIDNHVNRQNGLPTDNLNGRNINSRDACERSDYRVDLSDKESAQNIKRTRKVIPKEEWKNHSGQDTADAHLYFVLENDDKTNCFPNQDPCTSSCSPYEVSDEVFVDNILYQSSDVIPMKTTTGPSEQKADDANLYFVLEDNWEQPCFSDNPCSAFPLFNSHQNKDSNRRLSGHLYEDIDSRFRKECTK